MGFYWPVKQIVWSNAAPFYKKNTKIYYWCQLSWTDTCRNTSTPSELNDCSTRQRWTRAAFVMHAIIPTVNKKLLRFVHSNRTLWVEVSPPQISLCHLALFTHCNLNLNVIILLLNVCTIPCGFFFFFFFSPQTQKALQRSDSWMMQNFSDLLQLTMKHWGGKKSQWASEGFSVLPNTDWDKPDGIQYHCTADSSFASY